MRRTTKCGKCQRALDYTYDEMTDPNVIQVGCPVCGAITIITIPSPYWMGGPHNASPGKTLSVNGTLKSEPDKVILDDLIVDGGSVLEPIKHVKWKIPNKLKGFDDLRRELDDLHQQLHEARASVLSHSDSIRSLRDENDSLRSQLSLALKGIGFMAFRVTVLEKKPASLDPKILRAFPEKPNYAEWVSEDEELLEDGYCGFPKPKERVVF